jgi:hypothetical protein
MIPSFSGLTGRLTSFNPAPDEITQRTRQIQEDVLRHSSYLRQPDFKAIHPRDLDFLFDAYDRAFFDGLCRPALAGRKLRFRLSRRMTTSGGKTTRFTMRDGVVSFEISIATSILFDAFGAADRNVTVCGLDCENRLDALQRIFEHELVHLGEQLCWQKSDCSAPRFQEIARRLFLHQSHTHHLITRRERAAASGIGIGSRVAFEFEGRRLTGRVNRITKRATVLVESAEGPLYSDGQRYRTYYVPIKSLTLD